MKKLFLKNSLTIFTGIFITVLICNETLNQKLWENPGKVIESDVKGYYSYLPALFIYNDIKLKNTNHYLIDGDMKLWHHTTKSGQRYIKYPTGMAMMYSPFFAIAHLVAKTGNYPPNGYSEIYKFWIVTGSLFYVFIGIIFLSKLLLLHFDDKTTASTLIIIYLATNLFHYSTYQVFLSHTYSFTLFCVYMYYSIKWISSPGWKYAFLLSFSGGLLIAVRNLDFILIFFILLYDIKSISQLKNRFLLFWKYRLMTLVGVFIVLLTLTPQFLYNSIIFGNLFHYSYNQERFFFSSPHLIDSLISYKNGWLIYSPIMIFSIIGFLFIRKNASKIFLSAIFIIPIYYYCLASWWCWWFVGFGNRAYINIYPILAFTIASFISYLHKKQFWGTVSFNILIISTIILNYFQTFQFNKGVIHYEGMNKTSYWYLFGKQTPSQIQAYIFTYPNINAAMNGYDTLYSPKFDTLSKEFLDQKKLISLKNSTQKIQPRNLGYHVPKENEFDAQYSFLIPEGTTHIYGTAWIYGKGEEILVFSHSQNPTFYYASSEINKSKGLWNQIHIMAPLPKNHSIDSLLFYVWNKDKKSYYIDSIKLYNMTVGTKLIDY